jgi:predicted flavoprotein YhiN
MESKKHPGLYFIGEVADADGDTGGYNLQFAFASAAAAAKAICG